MPGRRERWAEVYRTAIDTMIESHGQKTLQGEGRPA